MTQEKEKIDGIDTKALKQEIKQELIKQKILAALEDDEINLSEYFAIFERHILMLILFPLIFGLIAYFTYQEKTYYVSTATIYMHSSSGSSGGGVSSQLGGLSSILGLGGGGSSNSGGYLGVMLKSRKMANEILSKINIASYPGALAPDWKDISFGADGLMTLTMSTTMATLSMNLVNTTLATIESQMKGPAKRKRMYLEKKLAWATDELAKTEEIYKAFQEKNQALTFDAKAGVVYTRLYGFHDKLFDIDFEGKVNEKLLKLLGRLPEILQIESKKITDEVRKQVTLSAIPEIEKELVGMPALSLEFKKMQRNLELRESLYAGFVTQLEAAKVADIEEESQFEVIDEAQPGSPTTLMATKKIIAAAVIGFFIALSIAIIIELRRKEKPAA